MEKKALLVQTTFLSRVIVDVDNDGNIINWDNLVEQVEDCISEKINNEETGENIETWFDDEECPYGTMNGED